jgi:hypothetical protein
VSVEVVSTGAYFTRFSVPAREIGHEVLTRPLMLVLSLRERLPYVFDNVLQSSWRDAGRQELLVDFCFIRRILKKETDLGNSCSLMQHAEGEAKNQNVRKCEHFARHILAAMDALEREAIRRKSD